MGRQGNLQLSPERGTRSLLPSGTASQLKGPQDPLKLMLGPSLSFVRWELGESHSPSFGAASVKWTLPSHPSSPAPGFRGSDKILEVNALRPG